MYHQENGVLSRSHDQCLVVRQNQLDYLHVLAQNQSINLSVCLYVCLYSIYHLLPLRSNAIIVIYKPSGRLGIVRVEYRHHCISLYIKSMQYLKQFPPFTFKTIRNPSVIVKSCLNALLLEIKLMVKLLNTHKVMVI